MREIIFRGKPIDPLVNGGWLEGSLITDYEDDFFYIEGRYFSPAPVIAESIGQYTGLKDKKGRKIYEGDILLTTKILNRNLKKGDISKVTWSNSECNYNMLTFDGGYMGNLTENKSSGIEIIGNVFESPELINK